MDIKKTAIVTAIFDIGRDKWDNYVMSYHTYLWWMRNLLYLDTNLIIYTEEKFKNDILNYRKEVDPKLDKTILIIEPLEKIDGYKKFYGPLNNLMSSAEFKSKIQFEVPEMIRPLYNVVMFAKLFYIRDAARKNLFDADLYAWADAGVIRNDKPTMNLKWPDIQKINELDNNKVTFFCHHPYVRVDRTRYMDHALSQMRYIQGGAVFVPKKCVDDVCDIFEKTALECIANGFVGSDEKIFDFTYLTNPDNYNLVKCGWREYIDLFTTTNDLEVVVARYNEDIEWTKGLKYKVNIFNKNESDNHLFENNLPNVGREGHTFFNYIVNNYDNLPEYIAFLQGNPMDHCGNVINQINEFDFKSEFKALGTITQLTMEYEAINQQVQNFSQQVGFNITYPIHMVPGAQYIVSRRLIRNNPIEFYKRILNLLDKELYPQAGLDVEKTLFQIYKLYKW
jgi:protein YibB